MKSPVRKARLTRRKKLIPWTAFGIAAPLLYLALVLIRGLSPILISSETTFVTEPIHSSGYVDLTEEINKCLRHNVAPNVTLKPKAILDALNRLETAVGPVDLRLDATAVTWTPDLQVEIDNVLEQIARQEGVIQCPLPPAGGPVKYMAIESKPADDLSSALLPLRRTLTSLLLRRLRESIEAGDSAEAIRDIQSLNDVVRFLLRQKTVLALHVAFSIQQETTDQMANAMAMESLRPEQVRALVPHVPQLEASELQAVARTQRLHALSLIFLTHSGMDATGARPVGLTRPWVERTVNAVRERWMLANADWNAVCRHNNEFFDVAERTVIATDQSIHDQSVAEASALSSCVPSMFICLGVRVPCSTGWR